MRGATRTGGTGARDGGRTERRQQGRPLVDDPWRAVSEFVVGANGRVRLAYTYQYCEDYPNPQLLITAAQISRAQRVSN